MMKKGDRVRIRALGSSDDWADAWVALVSPNGVSVGLLLNGIVRSGRALVTGALPLLIDQKAGTVTDLMGGEYEVEP